MVTLKGAENIPAADPNGLSDPYCILTLNKEEKKSAVQLRTLTPVWEEKFDWTRVSGCLPVWEGGAGRGALVCAGVCVGTRGEGGLRA